MYKEYHCRSVKDVSCMADDLRKYTFSCIDRVENLGCSHFYDEPLFLFLENHVMRIWFTEKQLDLSVYDRAFFFDHIENNHIFRDPVYPGEFDYIGQENYAPDATLCNITAHRSCGTTDNLKGVYFHLSDGSKLYICESEQIPDCAEARFIRNTKTVNCK